MADISSEDRQKVKEQVEHLRACALQEIKQADQCRGGGPSPEAVRDFVTYDLWLTFNAAATPVQTPSADQSVQSTFENWGRPPEPPKNVDFDRRGG